MSKNIVQKQREKYQPNFIKYGDSPEGTYQNNTITQHMRFANLVRDIAPFLTSETSVHDIGSGLCDIYPFLNDFFDFKVNYSGTEIVEEMNELARKKYPEIQLFNRDIVNEKIIEKYDFIILSGTLNIPGDVSAADWKNFCFSIIESMFKISNCGIAFNFLTTYKTKDNPELFYLDPKEVFDFCATKLSRFVSINASYPLYECSVTVMKKDYMSEVNNHEDLKKYFAH